MAGLERRNHGTWRVYWRQDGTRCQQTFPTEPEAVQFHKLIEGSGNRWPKGWVPGVGAMEGDTSGVSLTPSGPTLRDWTATVMGRRTDANRRTRSDYERDLNRNAFPFTPVAGGPDLGATPVDMVTLDHLAAWVMALKDGDWSRFPGERSRALSDKTIRNLHGLLSGIFTEAVAEGLITRSPITSIGGFGKGVKVEKMQVLTPAEYRLILSHVSEHYRPLVTLLAGTGLRWSEATALACVSVEVFAKRKTVTVSRAWKRAPDNTFYLGEPKTSTSRRTIAIADDVVDALIPLVATADGNDFLFSTKASDAAGARKPVRHANFYNRVWLPAVARANADGLGKRPTIHDLRHSHISWLIDQNRSVKSIQHRAGHSTITTTMDRYGHLLPHDDEDTIAALNRAMATPADDLDLAPAPI